MSLLAAQPGHAALMNCPASFVTDGTAIVTHSGSTDTAASACQYLDPPDQSNVANLANINAAGFFGFSDWMDNGQTQTGGGGLSGTWSIANVDFALFDYMITYKDGSETNLISFLLNEEVSSGDWTTPFLDPPFNITNNDNFKSVSHFSIVKRENFIPPPPPFTIPEPASLSLFGIGLLGLGFMGYRRRRDTRA